MSETDCILDIIGLMVLPFVCDWLWMQIQLLEVEYEKSILQNDGQ